MPRNCVFDTGGSCIFANKEFKNVFYLLGFMNSKLVSYIVDCLNPTINAQVGDMQRIPFVIPSKTLEKIVDDLSQIATQIQTNICSFSISEPNYSISPIQFLTSLSDIKTRIKAFFNYENHLLTQVLINEAIINEKIFEIYELTPADKAIALAKEGESIGGLPVCEEGRAAYLAEQDATQEFPLNHIQEFINALPVQTFTAEERQKIEAEFPALYQNNNDLEAFCIRHAVNPINVWAWFKQTNVIPKQRMNDLAMEFLADLSLDAPDFETARGALSLQGKLKDYYFPSRPQ
jgi:hypothetical protein